MGSLPNLTGNLKNWEYIANHNVYYGRIFNDAKHRFRDGTNISTSSVVKTEEISDAFIVYTLNSIYFLRKDDKKGYKHGSVGGQVLNE